MKSNTSTPAKKTVKIIMKHRKSVKGMRGWVLKHLAAIFLALFLVSIVSPVNAAPRKSKTIKSNCRHKVITRNYPVIVAKKSNPVMKKLNSNNSRSRKSCFPG
jgi:hypothetical protein